MLRFFTALILILLCFAACSRSGTPVTPDSGIEEDQISAFDGSFEGNYIPAEGPGQLEGLQPWGLINLLWDSVNGKISYATRSADIAIRHYRVSYFLNPPWCSDCIDIQLVENNAALGTGDFVVTLKNPTALWAYDVRTMLLVAPGVDLMFLNADGYTTLFESPDYQYPAPFRMFARTLPDHQFQPGSSHNETLELKTTPGSLPVGFNFLVTAGHPSPAGDVSRIGDFNQVGQLIPGGGSAWLYFDIDDLQDDIAGACVRANALGAGDVWLSESAGKWVAQLTNSLASPGIYELKVEAWSDNLQGAVTSHYYRAVVFHDLTQFRNDLLNLVNQDRTLNGVPSLQLDADLNTVAQAHAQDMADNQYFDHVNLFNWSPWQRMDYYGVDYSSAGENIAVGQDTPGDVETAWMASPGHKANIINSNFGRIGFGIVPINPGDLYAPGYYWVQLFRD